MKGVAGFQGFLTLDLGASFLPKKDVRGASGERRRGLGIRERQKDGAAMLGVEMGRVWEMLVIGMACGRKEARSGAGARRRRRREGILAIVW